VRRNLLADRGRPVLTDHVDGGGGRQRAAAGGGGRPIPAPDPGARDWVWTRPEGLPYLTISPDPQDQPLSLILSEVQTVARLGRGREMPVCHHSAAKEYGCHRFEPFARFGTTLKRSAI